MFFTTEVMDLLYTTLLCVLTVAVIYTNSATTWVLLMGGFSMCMVGFYTMSNAVDVAITEIAVGYGIGTILLLLAVKETTNKVKKRKLLKPIPLAIVFVVIIIWFNLSSDMPLFGGFTNPIQMHVEPFYLAHSGEDTGVPNYVTSILASYRGYDTMGETTVIFTASMGVMSLLTNSYDKYPNEPVLSVDYLDDKNNLILRIAGKIMLPLLMLYAFYVQFHGDFGPGGGFQAGVIFSASLTTYALTHGTKDSKRAFKPAILRIMLSVGILFYVGTGVLAWLLQYNFLDYYSLIHNHHGQELGINLVEMGVGFAVCSAMTVFFIYFFDPSVRYIAPLAGVISPKDNIQVQKDLLSNDMEEDFLEYLTEHGKKDH